jgi:hypothetical protein
MQMNRKKIRKLTKKIIHACSILNKNTIKDVAPLLIGQHNYKRSFRRLFYNINQTMKKHIEIEKLDECVRILLPYIDTPENKLFILIHLFKSGLYNILHEWISNKTISDNHIFLLYHEACWKTRSGSIKAIEWLEKHNLFPNIEKKIQVAKLFSLACFRLKMRFVKKYYELGYAGNPNHSKAMDNAFYRKRNSYQCLNYLKERGFKPPMKKNVKNDDENMPTIYFYRDAFSQSIANNVLPEESPIRWCLEQKIKGPYSAVLNEDIWLYEQRLYTNENGIHEYRQEKMINSLEIFITKDTQIQYYPWAIKKYNYEYTKIPLIMWRAASKQKVRGW